jgi:hypothetical protein
MRDRFIPAGLRHATRSSPSGALTEMARAGQASTHEPQPVQPLFRMPNDDPLGDADRN